MSGVYISGMEMPQKGKCTTVTIFPDGAVVRGGGSELMGEAFQVPDHGRLIDADALIKEVEKIVGRDPYWLLVDAPTIIPSDKEAEQT